MQTKLAAQGKSGHEGKKSVRMKEIRSQMRLTQEEFSQKLGVSRNYVGLIEGGQEPSDTLYMLAEALAGGFSKQILTMPECPPSVVRDEAHMTCGSKEQTNVEELSEAQRKLVLLWANDHEKFNTVSKLLRQLEFGLQK